MAQYKFNRFTYEHVSGKNEEMLKIHHGKDKPKNLFKFYSLSENSANCLTKGYFYASHPFDLNDILDGSLFLINSSTPLPYKLYQNFFAGLMNEEKIQKFYNQDKQNNSIWFADFFWQRMTNKLGVISMTSKENNLLMWPHYTNERGFQLKFSRKKLEQSIIDNLPGTFMGLYPMNYSKELQQLDISKVKSEYIAMLYGATVKSKFWSYESEWRFLIGNENMGVPFSKSGMDPRPDLLTKRDSRNVFYDQELIEEITFGTNFIIAKDFIIKRVRDNGVLTSKTIATIKADCPKRMNYISEILNYCVKYLNNKTYFSSHILIPNEHGQSVNRSKVRVEIEQLDNYTYSIYDTKEVKMFK